MPSSLLHYKEDTWEDQKNSQEEVQVIRWVGEQV